ncbi:MAG: recombinase family protein [Methanobacterium sp.]|uniref:recombinase family protein n=1 Tax=Methanobacterium sp. TaxID=2164 RepID=UPI003D656691|nr:recombinase family protein [Methanobacterium sp.]
MKIGYARVSTYEQNLDSQIDDLHRAGCEKIISEKVTTRHQKRTELTELLCWLRENDVLVCTKMDRLARNIRELLEIIDNLSYKNVNVIFLDQNIDTSQSSGRLIFHIFAAFAEFERDIIRERTLAGLMAARIRGKKGGRRKVLTGKKLETAFKMYDSKEYTVRHICETLNIKERTFYEYIKKRKEK